MNGVGIGNMGIDIMMGRVVYHSVSGCWYYKFELAMRCIRVEARVNTIEYVYYVYYNPA